MENEFEPGDPWSQGYINCIYCYNWVKEGEGDGFCSDVCRAQAKIEDTDDKDDIDPYSIHK